MTRKYYAERCLYGVNTSYDSVNRHAYDFLAFATKKEREEWLEENCYDTGRLVARATTRKAVEYCKGKNFKVVNMNGINIVVKNDSEIDNYLHGKEV